MPTRNADILSQPSTQQHHGVENTLNSLSNQEETKQNITSMSPLDPLFPARCEEMLFKVQSEAGVVEVGGLTYRLQDDFKAGTYLLVCKDVTPGLPPRMQMKHTKILVKFVDLDPPAEEETKVDPKGKPGTKKK